VIDLQLLADAYEREMRESIKGVEQMKLKKKRGCENTYTPTYRERVKKKDAVDLFSLRTL
jgi:hypothetical protein